jgi:hypothetical protein
VGVFADGWGGWVVGGVGGAVVGGLTAMKTPPSLKKSRAAYHSFTCLRLSQE